jgi:hypothetical protein
LESPGGVPVFYPNPITTGNTAKVRIALDAPGWIQIKVFTLSFRKIYEETFPDLPAETLDLPLDLGRFTGAVPANGLYYLSVKTQNRHWNVKFMILR